MPKTPEHADTHTDAVEIAGVTLTHPGKLLWPEQGATKRDLADHYAAVAGRILPHVANRPLTLVRCPSGRRNACFVQKHPWPGLPKAVRRVRAGDEEWLAVDDLAGVVALVQVGVLELHPWGATADDLERPDRVVLDLDPGEGVEWRRVVAGARALRADLEGLGLRSFVKTTGGKGLHVVLPVEPAAGWEVAKGFARGVAAGLAGREPDRYTTNPLKDARTGRIFLDHLRNSRGATAVAPYSTRAKPGAPVATPLEWESLSGDPAVNRRTLANPPGGGDPWDGFFRVRQRLPR